MQNKIEPLEPRTLLSASALQAPVQLAVGANPAAIATGDFNGDGLPDLVTASTLGTISILLNTGNGTFAAAQTLSAGSRPTSMVVGDFNGDTKPDIAVADADTGTIAVFLNQGNGTFGTPTDFVYGSAPGASGSAEAILVTGDFTGDGKTDLAVADETDGKIAVLLGNGNGTFATPVNTPFSDIDGMVAGNFNNDSMTDLAVIQGGSHVVNTLLSTGGGVFGARRTESLPGQPTALVAADFNGDGNEDLAIAMTESSTNDDAIDIAYGSSSGNFSSNSILITPLPVEALATGVFVPSPAATPAAGTIGLAAVNANSTVTLFQNNGAGVLSAAQTITSSSNVTSVTSFTPAVVADFSHNGGLGLAFPSSINNPDIGTGEVDILLSPTPPTSTGFLASLSGALPNSAVSGSKTRLSQILTLTNNTAKTIGGRTTINLYLSTTPTVASGATPVLSFTRSLSLSPRASKSLVLSLKPIPSVAAGSYFLVATATSTGGASASARSAGAVTLGAAFINLAALSLNAPKSAKPGARISARLSIQNLGNIRVNRAVPISLAISPSPSGASPVPLAPLMPRVSLASGQKRTGTLSARLPANLAAGSYYLVSTIDPNNTLNSPITTGNTAVSGKITVR